MSVSLVVPVLNEWENVRRLYDAVTPVLSRMARPYEIIFIDDGSTDGSQRELELLANSDKRVRVIEFRRNFGQTAALAAGFAAATGEAIITMDGDLQNDPRDIPMLLEKLDDGFDLVHGWRRDRKDALFSRRIPSRIANWVIAQTTGYRAHDLGCGLKAMRREIAEDLHLSGEMHRFIPVLAHARGAKCAEVVTRHHPRKYGQSKYGLSRTLRVLFDLITVKLLLGKIVSPMRFFGTLGLACLCIGLFAGGAAVALAAFQSIPLLTNPLSALSVISLLLSLQSVGLGLLGEVAIRIYLFHDPSRQSAVRSTTNFDGIDDSSTIRLRRNTAA